MADAPSTIRPTRSVTGATDLPLPEQQLEDVSRDYLTTDNQRPSTSAALTIAEEMITSYETEDNTIVQESKPDQPLPKRKRLTKAEILALPKDRQEKELKEHARRMEQNKKAVYKAREAKKKPGRNYLELAPKGVLCVECKEPGHPDNRGWRECVKCRALMAEETCVPLTSSLNKYTCPYCRKEKNKSEP